MRNYISIFILMLVLSSCNHPEAKNFNRDTNGNSLSNFETIERTNASTQELDNSLTMEVENGVRYVWIEINGIKLRFIFDTGASNICLSPAEATVLYRQGTLKEEDFISSEYFQDATGQISEGTKINLRKVVIGNAELDNVEAIVIDNVNAPLLLGQSVLERFGSIKIDNENNSITLK